MTNEIKIPVIDQHDRDGAIIGYASAAQEAAEMIRDYFLQGEPDADELAAFDAGNHVYHYSADTQTFSEVSDSEISGGYWAQA